MSSNTMQLSEFGRRTTRIQIKPKKKWRSAYLAIYCSRAFNLSVPKYADTEVSRSPLFANIRSREADDRFRIDQTTLTDLVKDKNLDRVQQLGGVEGVASSLKVDAGHGIQGDHDGEDIARRQEVFGSNTYKIPPPKGLFHFVWEAFKDLTILILIGCAALSLGSGMHNHGLKEGWIHEGSIFPDIILVIAVSAVSNYRQNRQFHKMSEVSDNVQVEALRCCRRQNILKSEIVVGDVIFLNVGDQVPADGLFLDGYSLQIDESSMTGEIDPVEISRSQNPFLFSGAKVVDGYGRMLVTSVGMNTIWGEMTSSISHDTSEQTPLQAQISKLTYLIIKVGLAVALLVLILLLVRYFTGNTEDENGNHKFDGIKTKADDIIYAVAGIVAAAVTIVVVAIPVGLPLAVALTLSYSMRRMMADKAMVRKLSACETIGSAAVICTHKTGTLTMNEMKVTKFWLGKELVSEEAYSSLPPDVLNLIREGVALNTTGYVYRPTSDSEIEISGSPTEKAILSWAVHKMNMGTQQVETSCSILNVEAFNSQKKRSGIVMKRHADNKMQVHWKGAAEMILAMCTSYYNASGHVEDMDDNAKMTFEQIIEGMAASRLRCIAFARKEVPAEEQMGDQGYKVVLKEEGLTLLGLVGLNDPCRPGVKTAVRDCQKAGVKIKMITGDNVFTAKAIATECGILKHDEDMSSGAVIQGVQFRNYTPQERREKVDEICVMARSSPSDKLLMVQCLKERGHVVAVTGDGTNDAPALTEADIGLSMGIQGTEVAKESSDVVIMDDNFASVATVLRWGRCVYSNIQKSIQFQLTVNVAAVGINFIAAISAGEVPLTAVQLLWVNLIIVTLGYLAIATVEPTKELMEKPPVGRTEPLIASIMWRNLLPQSLYQIGVLLTLQFKGETIFGVDDKATKALIFNTFVLCQVFNEFNASKLEKNVFKGTGKLYLGIIAVTIVLQVLMLEFLNKFSDGERLYWKQWSACFGIAAFSWPIGWVAKRLDFQVLWELQLSLACKLSCKGSFHSDDVQPSEDGEMMTTSV
ncbi:calcium-transporting ATPase 13 [Pyrus ussuriensis x Pyrus communis]|uniref:Calcium-transporting ATPase n=1 Tax=Pyrus ussuriensis x Pyrus communis TaxID=2448454 RepID=A0A5N5HCJ1_9ROSA|nr:calcium-transporting ATPase 13 [Pyrus ussuriensis x Pyrus communis]